MQEEVQVRYSRKADESLTYEEIPIQVGVTRNKIFVQILWFSLNWTWKEAAAKIEAARSEGDFQLAVLTV